MRIKSFLIQIKKNLFDPENPFWIIGTLILMALILLISQSNNTKNSNQSNIDSSTINTSIDTFVPNGYVLVTLQLINSDAIETMIGNYGLVDLYQLNKQDQNFLSEFDSYEIKNKMTERSKFNNLPIVTHARIIRAPNNQKLFGVLIPEDSRSLIQQLAYPVFAVIQRPDAQQSKIETTKQKIKLNSKEIKYGDLL